MKNFFFIAAAIIGSLVATVRYILYSFHITHTTHIPP